MKHYIKLITVRLNGNDIIRQTFTVQKGDQQFAMYEIPELKKGDILEVEVVCSRFGTLIAQETIE